MQARRVRERESKAGSWMVEEGRMQDAGSCRRWGSAIDSPWSVVVYSACSVGVCGRVIRR